ncbi:phage tail sheath subtilisin-like domain-containing protein [uncultured Nevskia sp.]|uniref:phage tail sheath subtilisin-like domain-containing protein n=1 Tax=uncultured Nevskia sp. TaxID=228950 RepID=UPI0025EEC1C0|nr:phage tail sheath subtilisin-like domain-containing protein [uncultured Nevskia sp.]
MPEYKAPGVYVEETSFRAKAIEGVPTSTAGFAGITRFGPVAYAGGPSNAQPRLITSYAEFERVYGGVSPLELASGARIAYLAHAVRAFFDNGGSRLYVSRVYVPAAGKTVKECASSLTVATTAGSAAWRARWPGADGNVLVEVQAARGKNIAFEYPNDGLGKNAWGIQAKNVLAGAVLEVTASGGTLPIGNAPLSASTLRVVEMDPSGKQTFIDSSGAPVALAAGSQLSLVQLRVTVTGPDGRIDAYDQLATHPDQSRFIGKLLAIDNPEDDNAMVWLEWSTSDDRFAAAALALGLQSASKRLGGGIDGALPSPDELRGVAGEHATGLEALAKLDDIAIVAAPDSGAMPTPKDVQAVAQHLIGHAELHRYRIALIDAVLHSSLSDVRSFRSKFDCSYAALYHPWIEIVDPLSRPALGEQPHKLLLPPSGFIAGIYARNDIERGVHKAPANEVVRGITRFEVDINKAQQDVLNPEGVNCLRFFEGRGYRVWGARTLSSDPEWKYVNLRRLFISLEHSIDKGTQWAVFEPNGERLWADIKSTIQDFLYLQWRNGALLGVKPEEAYFVRCDRSTMTQNDLDNGRMVCLIGIAASRPAEFVIFRISQKTADS